MDRDDFRRRFGVLDQMLSAHATLRDRFRRRAVTLTLVTMAMSVAAATLALGDDRQLHILGLELETKGWLAILAGVIFFLAIVELVVDWRGRSWAHGDAARRLGELKAEFRRADVDGDRVETHGVDLAAAYEQVTGAIVEIPNGSFNRLKARHRRKVAVSKLLDDRPGAPVLLLRWEVLRSGLGAGEGRPTAEGVLEPSPPTSDKETA
jgi:hypothetical protein